MFFGKRAGEGFSFLLRGFDSGFDFFELFCFSLGVRECGHKQ